MFIAQLAEFTFKPQIFLLVKVANSHEPVAKSACGIFPSEFPNDADSYKNLLKKRYILYLESIMSRLGLKKTF